MATTKPITVEGLRNLQTAIAGLGIKVERSILRASLARAMVPATRAIRRATYTTIKRRTGLLQRGIRARVIRATQPAGRVAAGVFMGKATKGFVSKLRTSGKLRQYKRKGSGRFKVGAGMLTDIDEPFYWRFIEFGTRRMKARPYIAAAFQAAAPEMLATFKREVAKGIERAIARSK